MNKWIRIIWYLSLGLRRSVKCSVSSPRTNDFRPQWERAEKYNRDRRKRYWVQFINYLWILQETHVLFSGIRPRTTNLFPVSGCSYNMRQNTHEMYVSLLTTCYYCAIWTELSLFQTYLYIQLYIHIAAKEKENRKKRRKERKKERKKNAKCNCSLYKRSHEIKIQNIASSII